MHSSVLQPSRGAVTMFTTAFTNVAPPTCVHARARVCVCVCQLHKQFIHLLERCARAALHLLPPPSSFPSPCPCELGNVHPTFTRQVLKGSLISSNGLQLQQQEKGNTGWNTLQYVTFFSFLVFFLAMAFLVSATCPFFAIFLSIFCPFSPP